MNLVLDNSTMISKPTMKEVYDKVKCNKIPCPLRFHEYLQLSRNSLEARRYHPVEVHSYLLGSGRHLRNLVEEEIQIKTL